METLPSCFYVKNLLDLLAIKECNSSRVTCGNCDKKSEEASYCFHCGGFWCDVCLNGHNILRSNKDHRVLSLKDFQDKDFEDVLKRPVLCQRELHEREVLKFYCKARGGGGDSHMKVTGMLVVSLRVVNCRFWSHLGC